MGGGGSRITGGHPGAHISLKYTGGAGGGGGGGGSRITSIVGTLEHISP